MKKRQNNSARASALQIALSIALLSMSAVLLASSFRATPATRGLSAFSAPAAAGHKEPTLEQLASIPSLPAVGAPFTFNNTGSLTNASDEYWLAHTELGFTRAEIDRCILDGFANAFLPWPERQAMVERVREELAGIQ